VQKTPQPGRKSRDLSSFTHCVWLAPAGSCQYCLGALTIHQHRVRPLQLLSSRLLVTQKDRRCGNPRICAGHETLIRPIDQAARLVFRGCEYGLDVVALVGERHMQGHKSFGEIHEELTDKGVLISRRHVLNLFRLYLSLVAARTLNSEVVQALMKAQGRLVLSMDAVRFDEVSPPLYVVREVISGEILLTQRVEKADTENLIEFLRKLECFTSYVVGIVTDKEKAMILAVATVFPGIPHQYCQTHFFMNLVKPMDSDLAALSSGVEAVTKGVREIEQRLGVEKTVTPEECALAKKICAAVRITGKSRGDKLFHPASLKRFTQISNLHAKLEESVTKKGGKWPLLFWLLARLALIKEWAELALRLSRQVEIVRDIAHLLNVEDPGKVVKARLTNYLGEIRKNLELPEQATDVARKQFSLHVIAVTERFWPGLFACYDVKELPNNNNDLESFFRTVKWHQRRAQGKKSTAGGPLESFAPLFVQLWPKLKERPELQSLLDGLSAEEVKRARDGLQALAEPARIRRSFIRDSDAQVHDALAEWENHEPPTKG